MHKTQTAILQLFRPGKPLPLKLREIGREIGEEHPQKVKHHLESLENAGLIRIDHVKKEIYATNQGVEDDNLISLPIMGLANCGTPTAYADNVIEGYLKLSSGFLPGNTDSLFILKAKGDSMNDADIGGNSIEDGDFVVVDESKRAPENENYVVSLIDDCANIKKFFHQGDQIALVSESTKDYNPIFIHESDADRYNVIGTVVRVIKTPKF